MRREWRERGRKIRRKGRKRGGGREEILGWTIVLRGDDITAKGVKTSSWWADYLIHFVSKA